MADLGRGNRGRGPGDGIGEGPGDELGAGRAQLSRIGAGRAVRAWLWRAVAACRPRVDGAVDGAASPDGDTPAWVACQAVNSASRQASMAQIDQMRPAWSMARTSPPDARRTASAFIEASTGARGAAGIWEGFGFTAIYITNTTSPVKGKK